MPRLKKHRARKRKSSRRLLRSFWFSYLRTTGLIVAFVAGVLLVSLDSSIFSSLQASIPEAPAPREPGITIITPPRGAEENTQKLLEMSRNLFPEEKLRQLSFESPEGLKIVSGLNIGELPALIVRDSVMLESPFSQAISDLFEPHSGYVVLKTNLVNPSGQHILKKIDLLPGPTLGMNEAPLQMVLFSDISSLETRVLLRNVQDSWKKLLDEGLLSVMLLETSDLDLVCLEGNPEQYWNLRETLISRASLSDEYRALLLRKAGVDASCENSESVMTTLHDRKKLREAIAPSSSPIVLLRNTGASFWVRMSGIHEAEQYQEIMTMLLSY